MEKSYSGVCVCDMRILSLILNHTNEETGFYSTFFSLSHLRAHNII